MSVIPSVAADPCGRLGPSFHPAACSPSLPPCPGNINFCTVAPVKIAGICCLITSSLARATASCQESRLAAPTAAAAPVSVTAAAASTVTSAAAAATLVAAASLPLH